MRRRATDGEQNRTEEQKWPNYLISVSAIASVLGGVALYGVVVSRQLATVPYVDQKHSESLKYTDDSVKASFDRVQSEIKSLMERFDAALKSQQERAFDHSDLNFSKMDGRMNRLDSQQQSLIDLVHDIRANSVQRRTNK